ncbi:hypothetical protein KV692_05440 [Xanthomonas euvesicatoria pv. physalidis]|uniref:hypothetical protein n=1 Tax=Xanthomonas euvesicatoria TaxID=456327 RepID=UPI001C46B6CF|nr:hypothetical protein [Xanthomonas euvesicatoria]MBV6687336.1 hypothetical protein [Xanthomonas euvesicatoria pv. physalidis]
MKRALKRWWVYLAAVPLADGKSAFRLGRSTDLLETIRQLQDGSPLRITRLWALPTCSERSSCAAISSIKSNLRAYFDHSAWMHMATGREKDKADIRNAMRAARRFEVVCQQSAESGWRLVKLSDRSQLSQ